MPSTLGDPSEMGLFLLQKTTIIANPKAGSGRAERHAIDLECLLQERGVSATRVVPRTSIEARTVAKDAILAGSECLVVAGGDGSLRNILDIVANSTAALALLPTGRGNDFAKAVCGKITPERMAASIAAGQTIPVDLGSVNGKPFATVAGCGLDAEVGRLTADGSAVAGIGGYLIQALKSIRTFKGYPVRVEVDGKLVSDGDTTLVACANIETYGGGFRIAPGADFADGKLEVCVVKQVGRLEALGLLPRLAIGQHLDHPAVTMMLGSEIHIESTDPLFAMVDGEVADPVPLDVAVQPAALRVVALV